MPVSDGQVLSDQSLESNEVCAERSTTFISGALIGERQSLISPEGDAGSLVALSDGLAFEELTKALEITRTPLVPRKPASTTAEAPKTDHRCDYQQPSQLRG